MPHEHLAVDNSHQSQSVTRRECRGEIVRPLHEGSEIHQEKGQPKTRTNRYTGTHTFICSLPLTRLHFHLLTRTHKNGHCTDTHTPHTHSILLIPSIHPLHLSRVGLRGQHLQHRDLPFLQPLGQAPQEESQGVPRPAKTVSWIFLKGCLPVGYAWTTSQGRHPACILSRCPRHLN